MADGTQVRILTAMELLEARREAAELCMREEEAALCANACILAKAWRKDGVALFTSGEAVLQACSAVEIARVAAVWADWEREENPKLSESEGRVDVLKKAWSTRLRNAFAGVCSNALRHFRPKNG